MPKTKSDMIAAVAEKTGISKAQATVAVEAMFGFITDNAKEKVAVMGFGSFEAVFVKGRDAKSPSGAAIKIADKWALKFKPGKETKDKLNPIN